jgi:hypothetical protein
LNTTLLVLAFRKRLVSTPCSQPKHPLKGQGILDDV